MDSTSQGRRPGAVGKIVVTDFQKDRGESQIRLQNTMKKEHKNSPPGVLSTAFRGCFLRPSGGAFGSMVQGGLEPPDALDRQDLGPASVLSRTAQEGENAQRCKIVTA